MDGRDGLVELFASALDRAMYLGDVGLRDASIRLQGRREILGEPSLRAGPTMQVQHEFVEAASRADA